MTNQLFFVGKTEQGLQEVLKQVGSGGEFTRLLPIQRQKLSRWFKCGTIIKTCQKYDGVTGWSWSVYRWW